MPSLYFYGGHLLYIEVGDCVIYVTSFDGNSSEPLSQISEDFLMEKSVNGELTVSFSCYNDGNSNPGFDLLKSNSIVNIEGYDFYASNLFMDFGIKQFSGLSTFYKHAKTRINSILNGEKTANDILNFVLTGIDYTFTIDNDLAESIVNVNDFGNDNVVALVKNFCSLYKCEFEILPDKALHFSYQLGTDNDYQYRYKYNISDVVLSESTDNLYTRIVGIGADGLTVQYDSPNQSNFGILEAAPIVDERFTDEDNLYSFIQTQIIDEPLISIQSQSVDVVNRQLGESVWYIYEPLNIEMKTRIIKQSFVYRNYELVTDSVVFGNSLPSTIEDVSIANANNNKNLSSIAVKETESYNGATVNKNSGLLVKSGDVQTTANAVDGFKITKADIIKFMVDTMGNLRMDGQLKITNGDGYTTLLEAFLDTLGGRIVVNDIDGKLVLKMGAEEVGTGHRGGIVRVYDDGENNPRVEMGSFASYGGNGSVAVYDSNNRAKVGMFAVPGSTIGGMIYVNNDSGSTVTTLSALEGRINNEMIATQNWVINYVNSVIPPTP